MLILAIGALTGNAEASYICNLTSTEIDDVEDHYNFGLTSTEYDSFLTAPFDCSKYGSLCDVMASEDAEDVVCEMWDDLRSEGLIVEIMGTVLAFVSAFEGDYGFPGQSPTTVTYCTEGFQAKNSSNGKKQVRVSAITNNFLVFFRLRSGTTGLKREDTMSSFQRDTTGTVVNTTSYSSTHSSGYCNATTDSRYAARSSTEFDGYTATSFSDLTKANLPESMVGTGTYAGLTACAYAETPWDDQHCP